jgi:hypothetical protein
MPPVQKRQARKDVFYALSVPITSALEVPERDDERLLEKRERERALFPLQYA